MRLKKIIRLETKEGVGMYFATNVAQQFMKVYGRHPSPDADDLLWDGLEVKARTKEWIEVFAHMQNFYFGFSTRKQCRRWIYRDAWLTALHEDGILVSEYFCDPSDVIVGHTQAVFCGHSSKTTYSILDYFKLDAPCPSTASPIHSATRDVLADVSST